MGSSVEEGLEAREPIRAVIMIGDEVLNLVGGGRRMGTHIPMRSLKRRGQIQEVF